MKQLALVCPAILILSMHGLSVDEASLADRAAAPSPEVVIQAAWGPAEGQAGLFDRPEAERVGPLSFCVDAGTVYLLDSVNARVLTSTPAGLPATVASGIQGWTIAVDGDGGFFTLHDNHVYHYAASGPAPKPAGVTGQLRMIEGYGTELTRAGTSLALNNVDQRSALLAAQSPAAKFSLLDRDEQVVFRGRTSADPTGQTFYIKRLSSQDLRILGADADGKILTSVKIDMDGAPASAAIFKGQDSEGFLYVELERLAGQTAHLEVHQYSQTGTRVRALELDNNYYTTVYKKTEVAPDGAIYHMRATPSGVVVTRYGKEVSQ